MDAEAVLEQLADAILRWDRQRLSGKAYGPVHGILLADQLELREFREIAMDPAIFNKGLVSGLYRREYVEWSRRPGKWWNQVDEPAWDNRVGMGGNSLGFSLDAQPFRDPEWPPAPPTHLDRFQRYRIRRALRNVPAGHARLRSLTRWTLAAQYGIRISDVMVLEGMNQPIDEL